MNMLASSDFHLNDDDFRTVRDVVYKHCGISLNDEKKSLVRARMAKQIRAGGFSTAAAYLNYALADRKSPAFSDLIDAISTNLTSFFRESDHFDYLSTTALPGLLKHKRETSDPRILAWSAACSSGEEPYSMAITILEAINRLPPSPFKWDVRVLATDISTRMLKIARSGIYSDSRLGMVPPSQRSRYFNSAAAAPSCNAANHNVSSELANIVRFRHLNLMDAWPFKGLFDFIFRRNVMIYFDATRQEQIDGPPSDAGNRPEFLERRGHRDGDSGPGDRGG